jgi:opacity protein-like surface antigen
MRLTSSLLALTLVVMASPAHAQAVDRVVNWEIGGGYTWTMSDARDVFGDGYNFNFGLTFNVSPIIGIEGLYSYNGLGSKDITFPVSAAPGLAGVPTPFSANMNMQYGTGSLVVKSPREARIRPYGLVGVGIYYRPVEITTPSVGFVPGFCSPWYYYCSPGGFVPTEDVIAERSSTDFGMVFGAGTDFRVGDAASIFVELRWHYIWGPEINTGAVQTITGTNSINANGSFLPLTFGIRF